MGDTSAAMAGPAPVSTATYSSEYDSEYGSGDYVTLFPPEDSWEWQAVSVFYFLVFFVGFLGNVFVLLVLGWARGSSGRLVDTFVRHLAVADLVFVVTLPLWAVSASVGYRWDFTEPLCRISSFVVAVNRFSNVAFLACMSVDRYLAVVRRLDSRLLRSSRGVGVTCVTVWLLALAFGVPSLYFRHINELDMCVDPEDSLGFQAYSLLMVLVAFVIPVSVIMLCYGAICLHLHRHCVLTTHPRAQARRRHTLKIVFAIVTAFAVSWLPFSVCRSWLALAGLTGPRPSDALERALRQALVFASCLAFVNSCANPAIYLLLDRHFRRRAARLLLVCLGHRHSNILDSLSSPAGDSLSGSTHTHTHTHTHSQLTSLGQKT